MGHRGTFRRIVDSLNEATLDDARWPETSALIDEACGAKGSMLTFGHCVPRRGRHRIWFSRQYYRGVDRNEWQREYFRNYYAEDEHLPRLRSLPDSRIVRVADLFTAEELKTSRSYNEAHARFEAQKGLNVRLDGPQGALITWGIADPVDATGWSSAHISMIGRILPHLRQYVRVRTAFAEAKALGQSLTALLDNARACVIQLGWDGQIVDASDHAVELLRRNDGLSDSGGVLRAMSLKDDATLQDLLARAIQPFGHLCASGSMMVRRSPPLPRLALHVKPVVPREQNHRSRPVAALVLIVDPAARPGMAPGDVEAALGLSPAETEIAVLLAEGRTAREIAAATGREYSTVRTHLKHIFAKLGVSRQVEVARLVWGLSSLPAPHDQLSRK